MAAVLCHCGCADRRREVSCLRKPKGHSLLGLEGLPILWVNGKEAVRFRPVQSLFHIRDQGRRRLRKSCLEDHRHLSLWLPRKDLGLLTHPEFGPLAEITTDGARRWWVIQSRGCKLVVFWTVASRFGWEYVINQRKQNLPVHIFNIGRGQVTVGQVGLGLPSLTTFPVLWGGESSQAVTVQLTLGQWPVLQCWIS
jgi:hypothetical protein